MRECEHMINIKTSFPVPAGQSFQLSQRSKVTGTPPPVANEEKCLGTKVSEAAVSVHINSKL